MKKQLVGFHSLLDLRLAPGIKRFKRLQIDISAKALIKFFLLLRCGPRRRALLKPLLNF